MSRIRSSDIGERVKNYVSDEWHKRGLLVKAGEYYGLYRMAGGYSGWSDQDLLVRAGTFVVTLPIQLAAYAIETITWAAKIPITAAKYAVQGDLFSRWSEVFSWPWWIHNYGHVGQTTQQCLDALPKVSSEQAQQVVDMLNQYHLQPYNFLIGASIIALMERKKRKDLEKLTFSATRTANIHRGSDNG